MRLHVEKQHRLNKLGPSIVDSEDQYVDSFDESIQDEHSFGKCRASNRGEPSSLPVVTNKWQRALAALKEHKELQDDRLKEERIRGVNDSTPHPVRRHVSLAEPMFTLEPRAPACAAPAAACTSPDPTRSTRDQPSIQE